MWTLNISRPLTTVDISQNPHLPVVGSENAFPLIASLQHFCTIFCLGHFIAIVFVVSFCFVMTHFQRKI